MNECRKQFEAAAEVTFVAVKPEADGRYYFSGMSDERMSVGAELFARTIAQPCERCKELCEHCESVVIQSDNAVMDELQTKLSALEDENARLKEESAAYAANLRGKHTTTGATYQHMQATIAQLNKEVISVREEAEGYAATIAAHGSLK